MTWIVIAAGGFAVLAGLVMACMGVLFTGALFSGRGGPVGSTGLFLALTMVAGPVLLILGFTVAYYGVRLAMGYAWPRPFLEGVSWTVFAGSVSYIAYNFLSLRDIAREHIVGAVMMLALVTTPAFLMAILLRSSGIRSALIR